MLRAANLPVRSESHLTGRRPAFSPSVRFLALLASLAAAGLASPATAAKWHTCPAPPFPTYPSALGATNAPFVHPGHELTIVLNEAEIAATGGFSEEIDGNLVAVTFHSPYGTEIAVPPFSATALGPGALAFGFPDTSSGEHGLLAGPVDVRVYRGELQVAHIDWEDLVALPPANDLTGLMVGDASDQVMLAAVGADGDVWFPAAFHGDPMAMPSCPGDFIFPVSVEIGGTALALDGTQKLEPLSKLRGFDTYFGDVHVFDYNLYGSLFMEDVRLVHVAGTLGVSLCKLNDAVDMVVRLRGAQAWASGGTSPFAPAVANCAAVPVVLHAAQQIPGSGPPTNLDSFDNSCSGVPVQVPPPAPPACENCGEGTKQPAKTLK